MRRVIIALAATIAGLMISATPSNAAPSRNSDLTNGRRRPGPEGPDFSAPLLPAISLWRSFSWPIGEHRTTGGDPPAQRRSHILEVRTPPAGAPERLRVASMMDLRMALAGLVANTEDEGRAFAFNL